MEETTPINSDAGTIEAIAELVKTAPKVLTIHSDDKEVEKLTITGDGNYRISKHALELRQISHEINTIDSLVAYLKENKSRHPNPMVFVAYSGIKVDLDHEIRPFNALLTPLNSSDPFTAFSSLTDRTGINQKVLWRALISDLEGYIDETLALSILQIKATRAKTADIQIDESGLTNCAANDKVEIHYAGNKKTTIKLNWEYKGPIFSASDATYTIPFRLEIESSENGIVNFHIHPKNLQKTLQQAIDDIIKTIKENTHDGVKIYAGKH